MLKIASFAIKANGPMQQGTLGLGHSVPSLPSTTGVEFRSNKTPMRTCVSNIGQPISTLRTFGYWHARLPQLQPFQIPVAVPSMIYNGSNAPAAFNTTSPVCKFLLETRDVPIQAFCQIGRFIASAFSFEETTS